MAMTSEQLYQRLLKKNHSSPSQAPTPSIKPDRRFNSEKDKEEQACPAPDDIAEQEEKPVYSAETIKLGRELASWIRECRRR